MRDFTVKFLTYAFTQAIIQSIRMLEFDFNAEENS